MLVKVEKVGICGSDVHYWHRGYAGRFKVTSPLVLGHESSGQIIKTGSKVTNVAIGNSHFNITGNNLRYEPKSRHFTAPKDKFEK